MKQKEIGAPVLWLRRLFIYVLGLFCIAAGVALSARSGLGVSPVGSPANVLYQISLDKGWSGRIFSLGSWTFAVYCVYILSQIVMRGRRFEPIQLLQIVVSFLFGYLLNLTSALFSFLPTPESYPLRMLYLLASIPFVALGVMLYLSPRLIPTPGEGCALAISELFHTSVAAGKTIFDCTVVSISVILSLAWFRGFVGVREGTVISALLTGFVMRQLQKPLQAPVTRFVRRENN